MNNSNKEEDFEIFKEAFFQTSTERNNRIANIENKISTLRSIFISLIPVIATVCLSFNNSIIIIFLLIFIISIIFWLNEGCIKKNQRGYVYINNQIQKSLTQENNKNIREIIIKYAFDCNGFNSLKDDEKYKKNVSFMHTLFIKNVYMFYLPLILFSFIAIVLLLLHCCCFLKMT